MNRTASKCQAAPSGQIDPQVNPPATSVNGHSRFAVVAEPATQNQLRDHILAGAKPRSQWNCGAELELFGFEMTSGRRLGHMQVQAVLAALAPDPSDHLDDGGVFAGALQPTGGNLTVEPGGQLEYSTAPHRGLVDIERELTAYLSRLREVSALNGSNFLAIGFDPIVRLHEQQWFPKPRYDIMRPYLARRGSRAWDMMTRTCATQVSLDFDSAEDLLCKFVLGNWLAPFATAIFANSPFADGRVTGFKSTRALAWLETDPDRCGIPGIVWSPNLSLDEFVEYARSVPMLFRRRNGEYLADFTGTNFREYLETRTDDDELIADWADHLTTIFTEARIKQVIELRSADCGSLPMVMAAQAWWKGLLYDPASMDDAAQLLPVLSPAEMHQLQFDTAREGLRTTVNGKPLLDLAREFVRLAADGLRRIAPDEVAYLDILQQQVIEDQVSPSDILLRNWHGSWHGSMERVFEYTRIA